MHEIPEFFGKETVVDWYLRNAVNWSHADRIGKLLHLVAAEKITARGVVRILDFLKLDESLGTETWRIWVQEARRIADVLPGAVLCLAAVEGSENADGRATRLQVAAAMKKSDDAKTRRRMRRENGAEA